MLCINPRDRIDFDPEINVVLVGEKGVGKTSLMWRFILGIFRNPSTSPSAKPSTTDGLAVMGHDIYTKEKRVRVVVWDTPGHDFSKNFPQNYFQKADAVAIVYDTTKRNIIKNIFPWFNRVVLSVKPQVLIVLVGTKCDVEPRPVCFEQVQRMAERFSLPVFDTSALTGHGVKEAFKEIADMVDHVAQPVGDSSRSFRLHDQSFATNVNRQCSLS